MVVHIDGIVDSIFIIGMLSCVVEIMNRLVLQDVLDHIGPTTSRIKLVDDIHLRSALSHSRNDGISNMLHTIYQQLISLLLPFQNLSSSSLYQSTTTI